MEKKHFIIGLSSVIALIIISIFVYLYFTGPEKMTLSGEGPATSTSSLIPVENISVSEEGQYHAINLSYPDAPSLPEIKTYVQKLRSDFLFSAEAIDFGPSYKYTLDVDTITYISADTITYKVQAYTFTGGAHGATFDATFTYGREGNLIQTKDLLKSGDSLNQLSLMARRYFKDKFRDTLTPQEIDFGTEPKEENFGVWYITDGGITFIFGQYQIGPYVLGIQEFPISRVEAEAFLNI